MNFMADELLEVSITALHGYVQLFKECNIILECSYFLRLFRFVSQGSFLVKEDIVPLNGVVNGDRPILYNCLDIFPVLGLTKGVEVTAFITATSSSAQSRLSSVTNSGKSSRRGFLIFPITSTSLFTSA